MVKAKLGIRIQQKPKIRFRPQLIQLNQLLLMPTLKLDQRIKKELEENPVLEEGPDVDFDNSDDDIKDEKEQDEFSLEDYLSDDDDIPSYKLHASNSSSDDDRKEVPFSLGLTFHESLIAQLGLHSISEFERKLAEYIIGNIDDDGYLRRDVETIVDDLAEHLNLETSIDKINEILKIIQDLDPAGVGAINLQQCLLIQIKKKDQSHKEIALATIILDDFFNEFTHKHYDKIINRLNIDEYELKEALDEISRLNPKPGASYDDPLDQSTKPIIPDLILENQDGELKLSLNESNIPDLRLNSEYVEMLKSLTNKKKENNRFDEETISFIKQKLDSARWFIDAINQRKLTLLLTMESILNFQQEYFIDGYIKRLKPMKLEDIAKLTNLHISTISRVVNNKYIQTDFGIHSLKYFFSRTMQTASGIEVSVREVKSVFKEIIKEEDKQKPLTDEKLAKILQDKGYKIARRTVGKYREQFDIPAARLRKELL